MTRAIAKAVTASAMIIMAKGMAVITPMMTAVATQDREKNIVRPLAELSILAVTLALTIPASLFLREYIP